VGVSVAAIGLFIALIGLSPAFSLILVLSFCLGLFLSPAQAALSTLIQLAVPDDKMGRANSAIGTATSVAMLSSMAIAGLVGDWVGLRVIYVVAGAIIALGGLVSLFLIPETESGEEEDAAPIAAAPALGSE
jgi:DHA1 family multidrug resistance protein-like MFS transporter